VEKGGGKRDYRQLKSKRLGQREILQYILFSSGHFWGGGLQCSLKRKCVVVRKKWKKILLVGRNGNFGYSLGRKRCLVRISLGESIY